MGKAIPVCPITTGSVKLQRDFFPTHELKSNSI